MDPNQVTFDKIELRDWQREALDSWIGTGRRAIVEAVTGSGKTTLGLAAAADALSRGVRVLVIVPGTPLVEQWYRAVRTALGPIRIGRSGDGFHDELGDVDVLITTVQSGYRDTFAVPDCQILCIADEVHRYGSESFSRALRDSFTERLGLTATLERSDDGVEEKLLPFFGESIVGCDYRRARADKIIAPIRVMTVAVQFSALEFNRNQRLEDELRRERRSLIDNYGCSESSFGVFFRQVQDLAKNGDFRAARTAGRYLHAFSARRELLATCRAKLKAIEKLGAVLAGAGKTLVFSETKESARGCADALASAGVYAESMSSDDVGAERTRLLRQFDEGRITALAAPRILDEGIDVPEADVGIIAAASSSRRQMVQRIGRVIRVKPDGRPASFVILYMQSSIEDPARGAHESFLEQLLEIADEKLDVPADGAAVQLANWLGQSMETVESARSMPRLHALSAVVNGKDVIDPVRAGSVTNVLLHEAIRADPDRFDLLLSCLAILSPQQIRVIVTRFGLGGGPRRSVRETAQLLRIGARDVVRVEDESLGRLEGQDVLPIIQLLCGEA